MYHLELNFATCNRGFPDVSDVNYLPAMHDTQVPSLGQEDPLEKGMATYSSITVWRIHGQRSLVGYSYWVTKESNIT